MEIVTWRGVKKLAQIALCGMGAALAAMLLGLFLGSAPAHASDDAANPGLLGSVTGILDGAGDLVGSTVSDVTSVATQTVDAVVAVAPAPVQKPLETVSEVVTAVTAPVQEVVSSGVVSAVTQPVVETVTAIPVVGDVVTGLGADQLVEQVGITVDETLVTVVGTVEQTGESLGGSTPPATHPSLPALPQLPAIPSLLPATTTWFAALDEAVAPDAASILLAGVPAASFFVSTSATFAPSLHSLGESAPAVSFTVSASDLPHGSAPPTSGPCAVLLTSAGSGGAGPGAWALTALLPLAAHRAWVRRAGPEDDAAPPAPASSTDVSPD